MPVGCNWWVPFAAQVSEKILLLDAEAKELRLAAAAADDRAEVLAREKMQVMGLAEELRADVAAKMTLLDEFEARFARQYRYACSCNIVFCVAWRPTPAFSASSCNCKHALVGSLRVSLTLCTWNAGGHMCTQLGVVDPLPSAGLGMKSAAPLCLRLRPSGKRPGCTLPATRATVQVAWPVMAQAAAAAALAALMGKGQKAARRRSWPHSRRLWMKQRRMRWV
jgi:hypothetical protein